MEDYIRLKGKLQLCKNRDIKFTENNEVDVLEDLYININETKTERIINFIENTKNPYMFIIDGTKVKFEFTNNGPLIEECLTNLIKNKNM